MSSDKPPPLYEPVLLGFAPIRLPAARIREGRNAGRRLQRGAGVARRGCMTTPASQDESHCGIIAHFHS